MKQWVNKLVNSGISAHISFTENKKTKLLNSICIGVFLINAAYMLTTAIQGLYIAAFSNFLACLLMIAVLIMNGKGHYFAARLSTFVGGTMVIMGLALIFGESMGAEYFIFFLFVGLLIIFERRKVIAPLFGFITLCFLFVKFYYQHFEPVYTVAEAALFYFPNILFSIFLLFMGVNMFKTDLVNYQLQIEQKNLMLNQQNEEIHAQHDNLLALNQDIQNKSNELSKALSQITDSVRYAHRIQKALLPSISELKTQFGDAFVFFQPKDIVSGDFYWYSCQHRKKILIAGDCTGHGVPGAFMTVMGNDFLNEIVHGQGITSPDKILFELDKRIRFTLQKEGSDEKREDGMDMSILMLDEAEKKLYFSGAKNSLCYVRDGALTEIKGSKFPIGSSFFQQEKLFELHCLAYQSGDCYYLFSDGFQDQFGGEANKKFSSKKLKELLLHLSPFPMEKQYESVGETFYTWKGSGKQTDDVLVIGIRVN